jgi:hypothetical protein
MDLDAGVLIAACSDESADEGVTITSALEPLAHQCRQSKPDQRNSHADALDRNRPAPIGAMPGRDRMPLGRGGRGNRVTLPLHSARGEAPVATGRKRGGHQARWQTRSGIRLPTDNYLTGLSL